MKFQGIVVSACLVAGLVARAGTFSLPHKEGDERIYAALLDQIRSGHGYSLQGHPILTQDWMIAEQYDTPLFYHPPAGLAWFALFTTLFGERGWEIAELATFAIFFLATVALARDVLPPYPPLTAWTVGALAAFTPIVAHVSMHRWLDGPQVAAVALAAWLVARAMRRGGVGVAVVAGAALGAACLVKLNAVLAVPGLVALAWVCADETATRVKVRVLALALAVAAVFVAPWLLAELRVFGTIFPAWAGRPSSRLVAENPFIHQVTAVRTPWTYLRLLPQTVWTIAPALVGLAVTRPSGRSVRVAAALAVWIVIVVGANVLLGALGYSKLLRYVVLTAPATVTLAGLAVTELSQAITGWGGRPGRRKVAYVAVAALAVGVLLEMAQGVQTMRVYPDRAWIRPLVGQPR